MKKVKTNGIRADASSAVPKRCGRCASAIKRNEFCPECMEFFQALSVQKTVSTTAEKLQDYLSKHPGMRSSAEHEACN